MSAACNSHLTNKLEADGAPSISAAFNGYLQLLKAKQKGKKSQEGFEVTSGSCNSDLQHRRPCTNQLC